LLLYNLSEQARVEREAAEKAAADELVLSTGSAEKELGNAAVQKKDMKTALQVPVFLKLIHQQNISNVIYQRAALYSCYSACHRRKIRKR
jgi:hypothetical protein